MNLKQTCGRTLSALGKLLLILWCAFSVFSLVWIVISAFKTVREFYMSAWSVPKILQWKNFGIVWEQYKLGSAFFNSLKCVLLGDLLVLFAATPAAYIFARVNFKPIRILSTVVVLCMGIPQQLLLIPQYFELVELGLLNTHLGLILIYGTLRIPLSVFLIQSFFKSVPSALEEAAMVDGATPIRTFFSVMLPLGRPGIVTALILNFIDLWNEFLFSYTFISKSKLVTLSVGLNTLNGSMQHTGEWTLLMAGLAVTLLPTLVVYLILSKQIIAGLTLGAVKG